MKYAYPAIFTIEDTGLVSVDFPDFESCYTGGDNIADAIEMAADVLALTLSDMEKSNVAVPKPSKMEDIQVPADSFLSMVGCDTIAYLRKTENRAVKKTLSIPSWLNEIAENQGINFSAVLQQALMQTLNIN